MESHIGPRLLSCTNDFCDTFHVFLALKGRDGQNGLPGLDGEPGEVVSTLLL